MNTIKEALDDVRAGKPVIVVDGEDRENEGDLFVAAEKITPEHINFMATHARGLICVPINSRRLEELGINQMVNGSDRDKCQFTVSVDYTKGTSTGISAHDRAATVKALIDPNSRGADFAKPGHIFPLRARDNGVLERNGHTEAAVDLARLAGLYPAGVICEIMNPDGTMARLPQLMKFRAEHGTKIITIEDLIEYRKSAEKLVKKEEEVDFPTEHGEFRLLVYSSKIDNQEHLVLVKGAPENGCLVRLHSQCYTGDVLYSQRCDCGQQLKDSMRMINEQGGIIVYLMQEGRGIGLFNKLKAYKLQDQGLDTVEANEKLGFKPDQRDYAVAAQILNDLGLSKIKLVTNNPEKIESMQRYGIEVERVALASTTNGHNERYLHTKKIKLGHLI